MDIFWGPLLVDGRAAPLATRMALQTRREPRREPLQDPRVSLVANVRYLIP